MKYYIQPNATAKHGYELVKIDDNGNEVVMALDKKTTDNYLYMPDEVINATNRRLVGINGIKKANVERYELTPKEYKEPRVLGSHSNGEPRKKLDEYLTQEEKDILTELLARAKARREEATKKVPLTPLEKARREYERKKATYEKLMAEAEA